MCCSAFSDPFLPNYGKHLTNQQVHDLVAPKQQHIDAVHEFLRSHGLEGVSHTPQLGISIVAHDVPVATAEKMFGEKYGASPHEREDDSSPYARIPWVRRSMPLPRLSTWWRRQRTCRLSAPSLKNHRRARKTLSTRRVPCVGSILWMTLTLAGLASPPSPGFLGQTYSEGSLAAFYKFYVQHNAVRAGQGRDQGRLQGRQVCWRWGDGGRS